MKSNREITPFAFVMQTKKSILLFEDERLIVNTTNNTDTNQYNMSSHYFTGKHHYNPLQGEGDHWCEKEMPNIGYATVTRWLATLHRYQPQAKLAHKVWQKQYQQCYYRSEGRCYCINPGANIGYATVTGWLATLHRYKIQAKLAHKVWQKTVSNVIRELREDAIV